MSSLESAVWHVLGYTAMPVIFLVGFLGVAGCSIWALSITVDKNE
ncbi:TIGR02808 family protein [Moritella sp. 24]|nr:TIGR02808 family protein [Moritella sp. 24]QUM76419.1 TIGR02808 family protein [Moritella sp. 24]